MGQLNMEPFQVRTDLALEAHEMVVEKQREENQDEPSKVSDVVVESETIRNVKVTKVEIGEEGAERIQKKEQVSI